jgi:hypothetical protein
LTKQQKYKFVKDSNCFDCGNSAASTFVFHIEERIDFLEIKIKDNHMVMDANTQFRMNWAPPPEVKETIKTTYQQNERIAVLEKHIEMLEQQIQELRPLR